MSATATTATAVYLNADVDVDRDGDEVQIWTVFIGDDDAEPVGKVYEVRRGAEAAFKLASKIASDRGLELVADTAAPASTEAPEAPEAPAETETETETCDSCRGSGIFYGRGYVENGVFKGYSGPCYRCRGTGKQSSHDHRRNRYYDNHVRRYYA